MGKNEQNEYQDVYMFDDGYCYNNEIVKNILNNNNNIFLSPITRKSINPQEKIKKNEYIEYIDFDNLILENCIEPRGGRKKTKKRRGRRRIKATLRI